MGTDTRVVARAISKGDQATLERMKHEEESVSAAAESFKEAQLVDLKLADIDLSNTEWDSCILDRVSFDDANLEGAYLTGCTLLNCSFVNTNLSGAALEGCVVKHTTFDGANVALSEFDSSQFNDSHLKNLVLDEADWRSLSFTDGSISGISGKDGDVVSWTLRKVEVSDFDASGLNVEHCTTTEDDAPDGFTRVSGRRKRV